jgi:two-component system, chemotaxis family, chemotaxis protein CheY
VSARDGAVLILIAEDERTIADVIATVVADAGHEALVAGHGRRALELARERWPALVITDLMMPHLDGAELIAALGAEAAARGRARPPVILLTSAGLRQARPAGADAVLRKPFDLDALDDLMRRLLPPVA